MPETPADTVAATPNGHGSVPSTPMDEALDVKPTDTKPLEKHEEKHWKHDLLKLFEPDVLKFAGMHLN